MNKDLKRRIINTSVIGGITLVVLVFLMIVCFNIQNKAKQYTVVDSAKLIAPADIAVQDGTTYVVSVFYPVKELQKISDDTDEITKIYQSSLAMLEMLKNVEKNSDYKYYVLEYNDTNKPALAMLNLRTYTDYFVFNNSEVLYRSYGVKEATVLISEISNTVSYGIPKIDLGATLTLDGTQTVTFDSCDVLEEEIGGIYSILSFTDVEGVENEIIAKSTFTIGVDEETTKYVVVPYTSYYTGETNEILGVSEYRYEDKKMMIEINYGDHKQLELRIYTSEDYNKIVEDETLNTSDNYKSFIYRTWQ